MYQSTYEKKAGSASLSLNEGIAGSKANFRLTYTAGYYGLDNSGSLQVLFGIASDAGEPQFTNPKEDNYVSVSSSNKQVKFNINAKSSGIYGKQSVRPWTKGFTVFFSNSYLKKGDQVNFDFKDWHLQTFLAKKFRFVIKVDPFGTAKYITLPLPLTFKMLPAKPAKLVVLAPTLVKKNKTFQALLKIEDKWGNPCTNLSGKFKLDPNSSIKNLPKEKKFKAGKTKISGKITSSKVSYITASYNNLSSISNPIISASSKLMSYWADLHGQTEETVGTNTVVDYFDFAKNYAFLDVSCHQGNDFQISTHFWKKINQTTKRFNQETRFITLPGYEWSANIPLGGDHNVIYKHENLPIYRSSHALIDDYKDIKSDASTITDLFKKMPPNKYVVNAHVGGRHANIEHLHKNVRSVEIHSAWGTFEWMLHQALQDNKIVGVVANSDDHTGRPGASYPGTCIFGSYGGLTCIKAPRLTRNEIFKALDCRKTYATTGARIHLDINCIENNKILGTFGDIVENFSTPSFKVSVNGTSPIDRVEIWKRDKLIHTKYPQIHISKNPYIKLELSGARTRGRDNAILWEGSIKLSGNSIINVEKYNFFNKPYQFSKNTKSISWTGSTTGGNQGFIIKLKKYTGSITLNINNKKITKQISDITQIPNICKVHGYDAKISLYQVQPKMTPDSFTFSYKLPKISSGNNPFYVKVIQRNGHMAWSSPIYLKK